MGTGGLNSSWIVISWSYLKRDLIKDMKRVVNACGTGKTANLVKAATIELLRENGIFPDAETLFQLKTGRWGLSTGQPRWMLI